MASFVTFVIVSHFARIVPQDGTVDVTGRIVIVLRFLTVTTIVGVSIKKKIGRI